MKNDEFDEVIDKALREKPDYFLQANFADRLTQRWEARTSRKNDLVEYVSILATVVLVLVIPGIVFYLINEDFVLTLKTMMSLHGSQILSLFFVLNFVLFADRVLLPWLFFRFRNQSEKPKTDLQ